MFSNLPPLGLVQVQTFGGAYSAVSVISRSSSKVSGRTLHDRPRCGWTKSDWVAAPRHGWDVVEGHADTRHRKLGSSRGGVGPHPAPGRTRGDRPRHPP